MIHLEKAKTIRALRLLIALIAGIGFCQLIKLPMSGWVTITTTVVLFDQTTVGGTVGRGNLRFMATLIAALISFFYIYFAHDNKFFLALIFTLSSFTYAYYYMGTKKSYIGILGIVTLAILLLSGEAPNFDNALYRLLDIVIGIAFALLSIILFFPEYATNKAYELINVSLLDIVNLLNMAKTENNLEIIQQQILQIENKFINDVANFNKTIEEAKYEWHARRNPQLIERYNKAYLQIRRLYRLIIVIFYYELDNKKLTTPHIKELFNQLSKILKNIISNKINENKENYLIAKNIIDQLPEIERPKTFTNFLLEMERLDQIITEN